MPQYYVEYSYELIISPEEFDKVQAEFERRKPLGRQYSGKSIFASRIVCGDCGSFFGPKVWNSNSKYRRVIWHCNGKFQGEKKCSTSHLDERTIKAGFIATFNKMLGDKGRILEDCRLMQDTLTDCAGIDKNIAELERETEAVAELIKSGIAENAQTALRQNEYNVRYNELVQQYNMMAANLESLRKAKVDRESKADAIGEFIFRIQELDALTEFDEKLWLTTIDKVSVHHDGRMTFKFKAAQKLMLKFPKIKETQV